MEAGQVFVKDGIEYCVCDVKEYGNHKYAYVISGEGDDTRLTFLQLEEDENGGLLLRKITNEAILAEIMPIFLDDDEIENSTQEGI